MNEMQTVIVLGEHLLDVFKYIPIGQLIEAEQSALIKNPRQALSVIPITFFHRTEISTSYSLDFEMCVKESWI